MATETLDERPLWRSFLSLRAKRSNPPKIKAAREPIDMDPSPALRIIGNMKETLEGRKVAILIADGSDGGEIAAVRKAVETAKGKAVIIAPKIGGAKLADGTVLKPTVNSLEPRRKLSMPLRWCCPRPAVRLS